MINKRNIFKRIISILTVVTIIIPTFTQLAISAEETDKYPYNIFGRNGIEINAGNLCINGDVHTNKEANITAYGKNINGKITTGNDIEKRVKHVYADTKIHEKYFTENCELYEDGYVKSEMNIHINSPIFSYRNIELDGNVALNSNIGTLMNINVTGEVKNANTSVVYSKYGNITIENDSTANINGLIYAPLGTLTINSPNVSINGIIIADKIIINGNSINLNGNDNIARFIGTESEVYDFSDLEYLPEDWLGDTDEDDLFDIYEKVIDTDPLKPDTDGDKLPDGYEVLTLNTDPLEVDTDENGVSDADEDFDNDNLNNLGEYENKTGPFNPDTDDDGLLDGDEIKKYKTDPLNSDTDNDGLLDGEEGYNGTIYKKNGVYFDPLNPDTNGNGILDGDEVFRQYKKQEVSTYDEAITEINVSMSTNGSLERNLKIESMYGIDAMSSDVFAMIGEPFNFETSTKFNEARITFKIDQSKLGDTEFDNLIILWYNEKEQIFEEMPTTRNKAQSTISTKTTHFSQYIIVDSEKWYANWEASFTELRKMWNGGTTSYKEMNTIFVIDCCSDMETIDSSNQRLNICSNIVNGMMSEDRAAVITYSEYGTRGMTGLTDKNSVLSILSSYIRNSGAKSNLTPAFADAVNIANSSSAEMNRIIILTNGNTQFTLDLGGYNLSNVTVNVVDMGGYTMSEALMNVASVTGGSVYGIASASDLAYQVGDTIYTPPQFIGEDSDGDTIPDIVEDYGLKPNGQPIGTNKLLKDTDGDGLDDNVELRFSVDNFKNDMDNENYYYCRALYLATDPTKPDTDDDGFPDNYLESMANKDYYRYTDPNPLKSDVTEIALENDFFSVNYESRGTEDWAETANNNSNLSYGGYQGWFGDKYGNTGQNEFCNGKASGELIWSKGCGLIAVADALLYLSLSDPKYAVDGQIINYQNGKISFDDYISFVSNLSDIFEINSSTGILAFSLPLISDSSIEKGINHLSDLNEMDIRAYWEGKYTFLYNGDAIFLKTIECMNNIKEMISNDTPVIISYSNDLTIENIKDYFTKKESAPKLNLYSLEGKNFIASETIGSHYMNITGVLEFSDDVCDLVGFKTMLEVATYGKKYYINYDEYKSHIDLVTNIMCIEKT